MTVSVLRGTIPVPASTGSGTATIPNLAALDAFVTFTIAGGLAGQPQGDFFGVYLTDDGSGGVTVNASRLSAAGTSQDINWEVTRCDAGEFTVEHGSTEYDNAVASETVAIADVGSMAKALVITSARNFNSEYDGDAYARVRLTATNQLTVEHESATTTTHRVHWQVVRFASNYPATVQRGTVTMGSTATSVTASPSSVDTAKSFLVYDYTLDTTVTQNANVHAIAGRVSGSAQLAFERYGSGVAAPIGWQLVTFDPGSDGKVERGVEAWANASGDLNHAINLGLSFDAAKSIVLAGLRGQGRVNRSTSDIAAAGWVRGGFNSSTQIYLERTSTSASAETPWQVVQWPKLVAPINIAVPSAGALALAGQAPTVRTVTRVSVPVASLALAGQAPTVRATANRWLAVPAGALSLAGQAPTTRATDHKWIPVPAGALSLASSAPTVSAPQHYTARPPAGALALTGHAPEVVAEANAYVPAQAGALALAAEAPTVAILFGGAPPRVSGPASVAAEASLALELPGQAVAPGFSRVFLAFVALAAGGEPEVLAMTFAGRRMRLAAGHRYDLGTSDLFAFVYYLFEDELPFGQAGALRLELGGVAPDLVRASLSAATLENVAQAPPEAVAVTEAAGSSVTSTLRTRSPGAVVLDFVASDRDDAPARAGAGQTEALFAAELDLAWGASATVLPQVGEAAPGWSQDLPEGVSAGFLHLALAWAPALAVSTTVDAGQGAPGLADGAASILHAVGDATEAAAATDAATAIAQGLHSTDFSGATTGASPPNWSKPAGYPGTWTVEALAGAVGGKVLRQSSLVRGRKHILWDAPGAPSEANALAKLRTRGAVNAYSTAGVVVRFSQDAGGAVSALFAALYTDPTGRRQIQVGGYVADALRSYGFFDYAWAPDEWHWMRVSVQGTRVLVRAWPDGRTEDEGAWLADLVIEAAPAEGRVGAYSHSEHVHEFDWFSVGTNGLAGVRPPVTATADLVEAAALGMAPAGPVSVAGLAVEALALDDVRAVERVSDVVRAEALAPGDAATGGRLVEGARAEALALGDAPALFVAGDPTHGAAAVAPLDRAAARVEGSAGLAEAVAIAEAYAPGGSMTVALAEGLAPGDDAAFVLSATLDWASARPSLADGAAAAVEALAAPTAGFDPETGEPAEDGLSLADALATTVNKSYRDDLADALDLDDAATGALPWEGPVGGEGPAAWAARAGGVAAWSPRDGPSDPWRRL